MGNGDYKSPSNFWRLFTFILSFSGFMLITTAVTYMLPVLSADVAKRKLSKKIFLMGLNPQEFYSTDTEMAISNTLKLILPTG
jgi:hypothetical protein